MEEKMKLSREEGIELGQKQHTILNDEELDELKKLVIAYRKDLEKCKITIDELTVQNEELEEYNKKANEEIVILITTLKSEQEKQKQLSFDLEELTKELKVLKYIMVSMEEKEW